MRRSHDRGQALLLMSLSMLLLVLMVCITLGIASRAREKAELQTLADAAAFSNATATARTYNSASLLNRAMVSHYAAMTTVQAHVAWVTSVQAIFGQAAGLAREFEIPYPPGLSDPTCSPDRSNPPRWYECPMYWRTENVTSCRSGPIRQVSYELWHAGLSNYHTSSPYAGDSVNGNCTGSSPYAASDCTDPRPWLGPKGMPELDEMVAQQVRDIHEAIYDLARIQSRTYRKLRNATVAGNNTLTKSIVEQARGGDNGWGRFESKQSAITVANAELNLATDVNQNHDAPYADTMGQAVMGARIGALALEHDMDVFTKRTIQLKVQADKNMAGFAGSWDFQIGRIPPDVRGMVTPDVSMGETVENRTVDPTMRVVYGDVDMRISLTSTLTCGPGAGSRVTKTQDITVVVGSTEGMAWHYLHDGGGHDRPAGGSVATGNGWNACHIGHAHYGENDATVHFLNHALLPREALGFFFPHGSKRGAGGIWGMPKLPVVLTKNDAAKPDPWELDFKFRFDDSSSATKLDLNGGSANKLPKLAAYSAGVAYYHRRNHVGEPPNMLNPFWRATLVPAEIDEHGRGGGDFTPPGQMRANTARDTGDARGPLRYDPIARDAYQSLRAELKSLENPR